MIIHKPGTLRAMAYNDKALYPVWSVIYIGKLRAQRELGVTPKEWAEYSEYYSADLRSAGYIDAYITMQEELSRDRQR